MARKSADKTQQASPETFEAALEELERIVAQMEQGRVPLDDSLKLYERGTFLIRHCQGRLDEAETQIEKLTRGGDGSLSAQPASTRNGEDEA